MSVEILEYIIRYVTFVLIVFVKHILLYKLGFLPCLEKGASAPAMLVYLKRYRFKRKIVQV